MNKKKAICLDYDDTICGFIETMCFQYNKITGHNLRPSHWDSYYMTGKLIEDSEGNKFLFDEVYHLMKKLEKAGLYRHMPLLAGAYELIRELHNNAIEIFIVTARSEEFWHDTIYNVAFNRLDIPEKNIICSKDKAETIKKIMENYEIVAFVDDAPKHLNNVAINVGIPVYCIPRLHNQKDALFHTVKRMYHYQVLNDLKLIGVLNGR